MKIISDSRRSSAEWPKYGQVYFCICTFLHSSHSIHGYSFRRACSLVAPVLPFILYPCLSLSFSFSVSLFMSLSMPIIFKSFLFCLSYYAFLTMPFLLFLSYSAFLSRLFLLLFPLSLCIHIVICQFILELVYTFPT